MYNPISTRNKTNEKSQTARFFKKLSHTDQNHPHLLNQPERPPLKTCHSTKHIFSHAQSEHKQKMFSKQKKNNVPFITLSKISSRTHICLSQADSLQSSQHSKILRKDSSIKQLKLGTSTSTSSEFPHLLTKSASQTTVNRKMDENKLKLLEKLSSKRKISKQSGNWSVNRFKLGPKLGSGRFGNVYLSQQKSSSMLYALKVMNKTKIKQADMVDQVFWQIKLQTYMNHPNILKLYTFFHDSKNIYLVLEYCPQCLFKQFRNKGRLSQEQTSYNGKQVISALKYMHNQSIIHRDIKPENIMISHGVVKLSDFGWSTYAPTYKRQTFCGTADYVPPEIVQGNQYDQRVDIWALGVLLFELAAGKAPFQTKNQNITYQKIVNSQCQFPTHFSKPLKDIVGRILDKNPERRPNLEQIQNQPWFEKYKSVGRFISREIWSSWASIN